jgi:hypothetical protein
MKRRAIEQRDHGMSARMIPGQDIALGVYRYDPLFHPNAYFCMLCMHICPQRAYIINVMHI